MKLSQNSWARIFVIIGLLILLSRFFIESTLSVVLGSGLIAGFMLFTFGIMQGYILLMIFGGFMATFCIAYGDDEE